MREDTKEVASKIIKEKSKDFDYISLYEKSIFSIIFHYDANEKILELTKEKREFGIEKYKEDSFQASFEKSITSPVLLHLRDELIDAINYCAHAILISEWDEDLLKIKGSLEAKLVRLIIMAEDITSYIEESNEEKK
jgi:hypothetical protein